MRGLADIDELAQQRGQPLGVRICHVVRQYQSRATARLLRIPSTSISSVPSDCPCGGRSAAAVPADWLFGRGQYRWGDLGLAVRGWLIRAGKRSALGGLLVCRRPEMDCFRAQMMSERCSSCGCTSWEGWPMSLRPGCQAAHSAKPCKHSGVRTEDAPITAVVRGNGQGSLLTALCTSL